MSSCEVEFAEAASMLLLLPVRAPIVSEIPDS